MSIPFEEIFNALSKDRQVWIESKTRELIEEQNKIVDCCSLIDASGSTTELAEFYCITKAIMDHHKFSDCGMLSAIRTSIVRQSGIPDEYVKYNNDDMSILSKALENYKAT